MIYLPPFGPMAAGGSPLDVLSVPTKGGQVLGADLKCSESMGCGPRPFSGGPRRHAYLPRCDLNVTPQQKFGFPAR
jgi:hypothetical protein